MNFNKIVLFIILLSMPFFYGCKGFIYNHKRNKDAREVKKKQEQQQAKALAEYEKATEHHASIQTKKTKRQMKKSFKQAQRYNYNKKEVFYKRWFTGKSHSKMKTKKE